MIRAIIFDFDGIFIDTELLKTQSYFGILSDSNGPYAEKLDLSEEQYLKEHPVGQGRKEVCEWVLRRFGVLPEAERRGEEICRRYRTGAIDPEHSDSVLYRAIRDDYEPSGHWDAWKAIAFDRGVLYESMKECAPAIPEARDFLRVARQAGFAVGLVTRTNRIVTLSQLQRIGLEQTAFGAVVCERDPEVVGLDKDSFYQAACAQLGIPPADSVAIEDTATGVASASKAGMGFVVAAPTFLTRRQDFLSQGADIVVSSLAVLCSQALAEWLSVLAGVSTGHKTP